MYAGLAIQLPQKAMEITYVDNKANCKTLTFSLPEQKLIRSFADSRPGTEIFNNSEISDGLNTFTGHPLTACVSDVRLDLEENRYLIYRDVCKLTG